MKFLCSVLIHLFYTSAGSNGPYLKLQLALGISFTEAGFKSFLRVDSKKSKRKTKVKIFGVVVFEVMTCFTEGKGA